MKSTVIHVRVAVEDFDELERWAQRAQMSGSALARQIVRSALVRARIDGELRLEFREAEAEYVG